MPPPLFALPLFFILLPFPGNAGQVVEETIAVAGEELVTLRDLLFWKEFYEKVRPRYPSPFFFRGKEKGKDDFQALLERTLLYQQASAISLVIPSEQEVKKRLEEVRDALGDGFLPFLAHWGMSEQDLEERLTEEVAIEKFVMLKLQQSEATQRNGENEAERLRFRYEALIADLKERAGIHRLSKMSERRNP